MAHSTMIARMSGMRPIGQYRMATTPATPQASIGIKTGGESSATANSTRKAGSCLAIIHGRNTLSAKHSTSKNARFTNHECIPPPLRRLEKEA